ncbi:hypothetical protein ABMY26_07430 (plasmid) [Azospirillum sp. HJ39]|uniref:hypothetical protein n=1 Tax=Azospirillum sp. HJ39 TaxID=3159496 RepID=UPI003558EA5C
MGGRTREYGLKALRAGVAGAVAMVAIAGTARADMPVIDATTWAELIAIGKTAKEELQTVMDTYNEINSYVTFVGHVGDMAIDYARNPTRLINEIGSCLFSFSSRNYNLNLPTLCEGAQMVEKEYFTVASPDGSLSEGVAKDIETKRTVAAEEAVKRGMAMSLYQQSNRRTRDDLLASAVLAESPVSGASQVNITNRLLVELLTQQQTTNLLLASLLEVQTTQSLQQIPIVMTMGQDRVGVR